MCYEVIVVIVLQPAMSAWSALHIGQMRIVPRNLPNVSLGHATRPPSMQTANQQAGASLSTAEALS